MHCVLPLPALCLACCQPQPHAWHLTACYLLWLRRDRAAERRKGLSTEFEGVPDDLVGLLEGKVRILILPLLLCRAVLACVQTQ